MDRIAGKTTDLVGSAKEAHAREKSALHKNDGARWWSRRSSTPLGNSKNLRSGKAYRVQTVKCDILSSEQGVYN